MANGTIELTTKQAEELAEWLSRDAANFGGAGWRLECLNWSETLREKIRQAENVQAGGSPAVDEGRGR